MDWQGLADRVREGGPGALLAALPAEERVRLERELEDGPPAAGSAPRVELRDHPEVREGDGRPMQYVVSKTFQNWGRTVTNTPSMTFVPKTKKGLCELVLWAGRRNLSVRAAGYRHSWSDIFSADGQVVVSMLPPADVEVLPAPEPPIEPENELQGIDMVDRVNGLCKIGAATTNEQFRRWCMETKAGGKWEWTVPFNVLMVETTWGGSNGPICHGAGSKHPTLSDLVAEIEFVNAKGALQTVSDPQLLRSAAGCFGLLGIVTSITIRLAPMSYAKLQPEKRRVALTVPPPAGFQVPSEINMSGITEAELEEALARFTNQAENDYYAEWFWFPYQQEGWANCWENDGLRAEAKPYPGEGRAIIEEIEEYFLGLAETYWFKELPGREQAEIFGALALGGLPTGPVATTPLIEALHFQRGIQNFRVVDLELEIPVQPRSDDPSRPDWSICQRAWWDAITAVYGRSDAPMRVVLEMRVMAGSDTTMAPQHGNLATCAIEVLTSLITPREEWISFMQEIVDLWTSYKGADGKPLNVRPHWAKEWHDVEFNGQPAVDYLRDVAYAEQIPVLRKDLESIAAAGGYPVTALAVFGNPLLSELFGIG
ncbi:MAG: hypothetical protein QOF33_4746 [Thermomicrobiales bacterium]|nr:hypothetical protein [Thermomicrobiales bacterium]